MSMCEIMVTADSRGSDTSSEIKVLSDSICGDWSSLSDSSLKKTTTLSGHGHCTRSD